jgi:CheY-like chemotaxis protein
MIDLSLSGLGILVLEDEPMLRKQIAAHLERMGADVTQAGTLAAAKAFAAELTFDFAFLDINLPDGAGTGRHSLSWKDKPLRRLLPGLTGTCSGRDWRYSRWREAFWPRR